MMCLDHTEEAGYSSWGVAVLWEGLGPSGSPSAKVVSLWSQQCSSVNICISSQLLLLLLLLFGPFLELWDWHVGTLILSPNFEQSKQFLVFITAGISHMSLVFHSSLRACVLYIVIAQSLYWDPVTQNPKWTCPSPPQAQFQPLYQHHYFPMLPWWLRE